MRYGMFVLKEPGLAERIQLWKVPGAGLQVLKDWKMAVRVEYSGLQLKERE